MDENSQKRGISHTNGTSCVRSAKMEKSTEKIDRRILKTKRAIRNALAGLLTTKDLSEITIREIADAADINRKTFYSYYRDVYQIVDEIENEIVYTFGGILKKVDYKVDLKNPYRIFQSLTAVINSDLDFYGHLLLMDNRSRFAVKIISALKAQIKASFASQIEIASEKLDLMLEYAISGMFAVYQSWFNSDRRQSIEGISKDISVMTFSGVNGLMETK